MKELFQRILFLMCLLNAIPAISQIPSSINYTTVDGLPSNTIYTIYKDHLGFLWFGTDMGVARYNGLKFECFSTADGLPDNEIFHIMEDYDGRIWLGTYNGRLSFIKDGKIYTEKNTPYLRLPFKTFNSTGIFTQPDSSVIVSYIDLHIFLNIKNGIVRQYDISKLKTDGEYFRHILKRQDGNYLIYFADKIMLIDSNGRLLSRQNYLKNKDYTYYYAGNDDVYWVNNYNVYDLDENLLFTRKYEFLGREANSSLFIMKLFRDGNDLFYCTRNGLYANDGSIHLLDNIMATCMAKDNIGNYWVGTYKNGLNKYSNHFKDVSIYPKCYTGKILHANSFDGTLYYTTDDINLNTFRGAAKAAKQAELPIVAIARKNAVLKNGMRFHVYNDNYYFYARTTGLDKSEISIKYFSKIFTRNLNAFGDIACNGKCLYVSNKHDIIACDISKASSEIKGLKLFSANEGNIILAKTMAPDGRLWFSNSDGLYRISEANKVELQTDFKDLVFRKFIFHKSDIIGFDNKNDLYLCSYREGRYTLKKIAATKTSIWKNIYELDSIHVLFSSNKDYQLLTLGSGADNYTIQPLQNAFVPLDAEHVFADDSNCYFFKNGDVTSVKLNILFAKPAAPKVLFTKLSAGKNTYVLSSNIVINQKQAQNLSIDFTAISYNSSELSYQYSITNTANDTDWHTTATTSINFPSLSFGKYYIKIRAKSFASDYSPVNSLVLTILRPVYLTWWFLAISFIVLVLFLGISVRMIIRRALARRKKDYDATMRYHNAEYKALNALMNPHFIFNSLSNIQGLINQNDKKEASRFLRNFSTLVRQNMHNVSKGTVSLEEELDLIRNYLVLEKMRFGDLLNYEITVAPEVEIGDIQIPPLFIQPLVENAIKHGILPKESQDGMVSIHVYEKDGDLIIEIRDNGIGYNQSGRHTDSLHKSYGLDNLSKRTNYAEMLHKQKISFEIKEIMDNGQVSGSIATLRIQQV